MKFAETMLDILFPPKCPFCGTVLEKQGLCAVCERELPWIADAERLWEGPDGLRCAAPLWYEDRVRDGIRRFKFSGAASSAEIMGALLACCAAETFSGEFDAVTWVPVSRKRLRKRGYDQARLLAQSACRLWNTEPEQFLVKTVDNPAQSGLSEPAARRANVLGVYDIANGAKIQDRHVLLVDDVCTTGATLTECVRVLRDAGAKQVMCVTVARTRERKAVTKTAGNRLAIG